MKAWCEPLSRHYLRSNNSLFVIDGCLFERQLPLHTLSAETHEQSRKDFTAAGIEAPAALFRVTLVVDNVTKAVTLNTWMYSNFDCEVQAYELGSTGKVAWEITCRKLINADKLAELWMRFVSVDLKADVMSPTGAVNSFEGVSYIADRCHLTGEFKSPVRV